MINWLSFMAIARMNIKLVERLKREQLKRGLLAGVTVLLIGLYCFGAIGHARRVNLDINRVDQGAYLSYTRSVYETNYNYTGRRNRMPMYAYFQSLFYDPTLTEHQSFTRGKYINIALTGVLLPAIFLILRRFLSLFAAVNVLLITAFTVFMFKAGYFQTELLFYVLTLGCFILMGGMLKHPRWWLGSITGIALGVTHLTKASVLPGLVLFVLCCVGRSLYWLYRHRQPHSPVAPAPYRQFWSQLLSVSLVVLCFLATIFPYINTSKQFYGHYFYNVNSTFYIWYNSWTEAEMGVRLHGDGKGWPEIPSDQIPSLRKYLREHSTQDILERFWDGLDRILYVNIGAYGYFKFVVLYLVTALAATLIFFKHSRTIIRDHFFLVAFAVLYFVSYLLLYAWYAAIASGERFVLAQFLPLMFSMALVLHALAKRQPKLTVGGRPWQWLPLWNGLVLGMMTVELYPIFFNRIFTMFAGT